MEQPVARWDCSSCHFSPTLASMLGATLIRYPVVAGCEPGEPGLWASLRRCKPCIAHNCRSLAFCAGSSRGLGAGSCGAARTAYPPCLLRLTPAPDALAVRRSRRAGPVSAQAAAPWPPRNHPPALALARAGAQGVARGASGLRRGRPERHPLGGQLVERVAETGAETCPRA